MAPPGWQRSVAIYGRNDLTGVFPHNIGIEGTSQGSNPEEGSDNIAGRFYAKNAWRNIAIDAEVGAVPIGSEMVGEHGWAMRVIARDHSLTNYGILVRASSSFSYPATEVVGISAGIDGNTGPNSWAGAFQGNVQVWGDVTANGYMLNPSDEQFKTDINSVENALGLIDQLSPKKYQFLTDEFSHLGFPEGEQYGIIAQELMEVVPELVVPSRMLTAYDTLGNVTAEPIEFLAVNYDGLIPILVAGMKEQQAIIEAQNEALSNVMDQLDDLQQQINNCCSGGEGFKNHNPGGSEEQQNQKSTSPNGNILNQNTPNPFRSQTTISYTLEQGGKVILNVYDKNGKVLETLSETEQQPGTYRYEWDASGLPAGLYHYALYVDGELMVKKAIKLQD